MLADNTKSTPAINDTIAAYGQGGLPYNLIVPAEGKGPAIQMPTIMLPGHVFDGLDLAVKGTEAE